MEQILIELAEHNEYMVLENLDVEIERRLVKLSKDNKFGDKASSMVSKLKNLFFFNLDTVQDKPKLVKPEHFVVNKKYLETIMAKYKKNEGDMVRKELFKELHFVSKQTAIEFLTEAKKEHNYDAYLILYGLLESKIIFQTSSKDELGRITKGFTCLNPSSEDYRIHDTITKLERNVKFIENKIHDLERKTENLNDRIKTSLKLKNQLAAKQLLRDKLDTEKKILHMRNQLRIFETNAEDLRESLHKHLPEECWKLIKSLNEKRMIEMDDLKDVLEGINMEKEANKELDSLLSDTKEEEEELRKELDRIELGMGLEKEMDTHKIMQEFSLMKPAFETTEKKSNPFLAGLQNRASTNGGDREENKGKDVYESMFFGNGKQPVPEEVKGKLDVEGKDKLKQTAFFGLN